MRAAQQRSHDLKLTDDELAFYDALGTNDSAVAVLGDKVLTQIGGHARFIELASPLLRNHQEKNRLLLNYACPADRRINDFLNDYLKEVLTSPVKMPVNSFILDRA